MYTYTYVCMHLIGSVPLENLNTRIVFDFWNNISDNQETPFIGKNKV